MSRVVGRETGDGSAAVRSYALGMTSHRDLKVWRQAQELVARVFEATEGAPRRRTPNIVDQLRRSVASIGANIAEGRGQRSAAQFRRYLSIALGSATESDSHVAVLLDIGAIDIRAALTIRDELAVISRMLLALHKSIR